MVDRRLSESPQSALDFQNLRLEEEADEPIRTIARGPWDQPHTDISTFVRDVASAARSIAPIPPQQYRDVFVLLIRWQKDEDGFEKEIRDLETVFKDLYHYSTERCYIPSKRDAQFQLNFAINDFIRKHNDPSNLLIIYYGGHGRKAVSPPDSIWTETDRSDSLSLNWSAIQHTVITAEPHVLFLFDCCYASTAATRGSACGSKELLAACSAENVTTGLADNSWTRILIDELKGGASSDTGITAYQLQNKLVLRRRSELQFTPFFHPMSPDDAPSIRLYPMCSVDASVPSLTQGTSTTEESEPTSGDRIIISMHLSGSILPPTAQDWNFELKELLPEHFQKIGVAYEPCAGPRRQLTLSHVQANDQPWSGEAIGKRTGYPHPNIIDDKIIKTEGQYESNSTLLMVSVPVPIWYYLSRKPAYTTIGYIKGKNIVESRRPRRTNSDHLRQKLAEAEQTIAQMVADAEKSIVKNPVYTFFFVNIFFIIPITGDAILFKGWRFFFSQLFVVASLIALQVRFPRGTKEEGLEGLYAKNSSPTGTKGGSPGFKTHIKQL